MELDSLIQEKLDAHKKALYDKYAQMYEVVRKFIIENQLLLYGGHALNTILPSTHKIYEPYDLPDYDFFAAGARKHAKQLADLFASLGYQYIEVRPGIHYETYKVYVDFMPVADITDIPQRLFDRMTEISSTEGLTKKSQLQIVPLNFLRMGFHLELSRPEGDIQRWKKIHSRMEILYTVFPIKFTTCEFFESDPNERMAYFAKLLKPLIKNYPIAGSYALQMYLKQAGHSVPSDNPIISPKMPRIEIIAEKYEQVAAALLTALSSHTLPDEILKLHAHAALNKSELIPKHIIIEVNGEPLICIYNSVACYSYKKWRGYKLATIDTMLSFLYAWMLTKRSYVDVEKVPCIIEKLMSIRAMPHKLFQPFEMECYGVQPTLYDLKKARWNKRVSIYHPK